MMTEHRITKITPMWPGALNTQGPSRKPKEDVLGTWDAQEHTLTASQLDHGAEETTPPHLLRCLSPGHRLGAGPMPQRRKNRDLRAHLQLKTKETRRTPSPDGGRCH